jgi:hypothetical protein
VVDGEELIGAKQNRIVNATFLIAGQTEITVPVSCVEQGRWAYRSQKFASGEKVMPPSMRLKNQKAVVMSLKEVCTLLFMSRKREGNWVTLFGGMHVDKSFGLEPELDGDPPG